MSLRMREQCTPEDCFQLTILALAETAANIMLDRSVPKSRRHNRINAMLEQIEHINNTYEGYLPDNWIKHSIKFNQTLETAMTQLLKTYKLDRGGKK